MLAILWLVDFAISLVDSDFYLPADGQVKCSLGILILGLLYDILFTFKVHFCEPKTIFSS